MMDSLAVLSPTMNKDTSSLFAPSCDDTECNGNEVLTKKCLLSPSEEQYALLVEEITGELNHSQGEMIFEVGSGEGSNPGLSEDELEESIRTLVKLAQSLDAECVELRRRKAHEGLVADYLIRRRLDVEDFMELRVAVVGNVDAGKSTLLGVLTHGELDNGRGTARLRLFRHKHEMESGRTSSVGNDILGFDARGNVVNKPDHGNLDWVKICEEAAKVITFIDLAGHEKYLKTTVFGMTGHAPDYAMLMIGANAGVIGMALEHLKLVLALNVPVFVVVTKIDMCPENVLDMTIKYLLKLLKSSGCRKIPILVQGLDDAVCCAVNFTSERTCPIFQVSNVTGQNLNILKAFLNLLATPIKYDSGEPAEFQIDDTFSVPGVGTVVSGTLLRGHIRLNDVLLLGPDTLGQFQAIAVKSIHRKRMPVKEVRGGQTASFSLKKIKRSNIRKGMVMVSTKLEPKACWEFEADIRVLHHPTTISVRYQAMVHVGSVRQTATIVWMSEEHLRTKSRAFVRFRFIKNPEYVRAGTKLVFREGRTKAVGQIVKLFPHVAAIAHNTRHHRVAAKKAATTPAAVSSIGAGGTTSTQEVAGHAGRPQNEPQKASKRQRAPTIADGIAGDM